MSGPLSDNVELIQASHCVCDMERCLDVISSLWLMAATHQTKSKIVLARIIVHVI